MRLNEYKYETAKNVAEALNTDITTPLTYHAEDKVIAALINALNRIDSLEEKIDALEKQILITADDV